jgi:hypothetical protein
MGMVLPATAEHLGYANAKENGQLRVLGGNEKISFSIYAGYIDGSEAQKVKTKIADMMKKS